MEEEKTFYEHLEELRKRIIKSLLAIVLASILAYFFKKELFNLLVKPLGHELVLLSPAEAFTTLIKLSIIAGIILSFPYVIYHMWAFISTLFEKEKRKKIINYVILSLILFYGAIIFCYFIILPASLNLLINFGGLPLLPTITFSNYINFSLLLLLSFGVIFQFPLVLLALIELGIISIEELAKKRIYVILVIFVVAAIITPTPDAINQIFIAFALIILFEVTLVIARFKKNSSNKKTRL